MLRSLGYQVTTRMSPVEALEVFRSRPQDFNVVITDLTMPQMTGDKLAREIRKLNADIPIILCTGFSASNIEEKAKAMGIQGFLTRPILKNEMTATTRKVLD